MTRRERAAVRVVVLETLIDVGDEIDREAERSGEELAPQTALRRMLADARKQAN